MATLCGFLARVFNGAVAVLLFTALVAGVSQNVLADGDSCCCAAADCLSVQLCSNCTGPVTSCKNVNGVVNGSCASGGNCTDCYCHTTARSDCECI